MQVGYDLNANKSIELEYRNIRLKNKNNSSDKSTVTSMGINLVMHRAEPIWRMKPYFKSMFSYVHNNTQYATKKGANGLGFGVEIGTYVEITKNVELSVGYEMRALIYQKIDGLNTTDLARGANIAAYYHF